MQPAGQRARRCAAPESAPVALRGHNRQDAFASDGGGAARREPGLGLRACDCTPQQTASRKTSSAAKPGAALGPTLRSSKQTSKQRLGQLRGALVGRRLLLHAAANLPCRKER